MRAISKGREPAQGSPVWTVVAPVTAADVVDPPLAAVVTTGTLDVGLVGGLATAVAGPAVTVEVSPVAPHTSVAPLLFGSPL